MIRNPLVADKVISERISRNIPTLIARMGATEAASLQCLHDLKYGGAKFDPISKLYSYSTASKRFEQLCNGAGVYPIDENQLENFYSEMMESIFEADIMGCWGEAFTCIESMALKNPNISIVHHLATSPWALDELNTPGHWSSSLEGKSVLVISPFVKTFVTQQKKLEKIFAGAKIPDFELIPLVATLSQGGLDDDKSWTVHLEEMKLKMANSEFDIALISAGSYGNPLALHAKKLGKIGISCGGELQLFFGVLGKRWETLGRQTGYINEFWVRPNPEDRPKNWKTIEDGCYW